MHVACACVIIYWTLWFIPFISDNNDDAYDDDYAYANNLNPNQSQDYDLFQFVQSEDVDNMKNATFKIVEASAY